MIKKTISSVSENILIKYFIIRKKFENFLSPIFDPKKKERGLVISGLALGIGAAVVSLGLVSAWFFREDITKFTLKSIIGLVWIIANWVFDWSANIFENIASSPALKFAITKDVTVLHGWRIVRSLANMIIVLGFVVVGIATILRIREYEAQKLLAPLIIVAILINFSLVICGVFIDMANIIMDYFLSASGPAGIINPIRSALTGPNMNNFIESTKDHFEQYVAAVMGTSISLGVSAMIFLLYGLIFLMRPVALMCLVILSPLAFACFALPATRSIFFNKWRDQFVNWVIIGIPTAFFLYLGGHIANSTQISQQFKGADFWVIAAFLLVGYSFVFQSGAMGANAVIGLATGAAGFVAGKVAGGAKAVGGKVGGAIKESGAGQAVSNAYGKTMEALHLEKKGTTAQQKEKRGKEALARAKADYAQNPDKVVSDAGSRRGGIDTEARAIVAAEEGRLVLDPKDKQYNSRAIENYRAAADRGIDVKDAEKKDPRLVQYNDRKINETMKTEGITNRANAVRKAQTNIVRRQSAGELGTNLTTDALKDLNTIEDISIDRHLRHPKFQENISPAKIAAMKLFTTRGKSQFDAINRRISDLKATGNPADAEKAADLENKRLEIDRLT